MGGPKKQAPNCFTVPWCIPQHYQQTPCQEIVWRRTNACCLSLKRKRYGTLCEKCHKRYTPGPSNDQDYCGPDSIDSSGKKQDNNNSFRGGSSINKGGKMDTQK